MVEQGVENVVLHTVTARLRVPWLRAAFRALQAGMEALSGQDALVSAWRPEECNGAVLAAVPYGAIPLLVQRTRRLWGDLAVQPMLEGGALLLAGVNEDRVAAVEEVLGLPEWMGGMNQPTRVHFLPDRGAPAWHTVSSLGQQPATAITGWWKRTPVSPPPWFSTTNWNYASARS